MKCRYCKNEIPKENSYSVVSGQYYCNKNCYDNKQREKKSEGTSKKIKYKPREGTDRREFTDKIQNLFIQAGWSKNKINWSMLMSQAHNILKEHEVWSYDTLTYILWYMSEVLELQLINKESNYSPLSLLEFYAKEAEDYFYNCEEVNKSIDGFNFDKEEKVIKGSLNTNGMYKKIDISKI